MHTGEFLKVEWLHQRISVFKDEGEKEYVGERVLDHRVTKGEMEYTLKCPVSSEGTHANSVRECPYSFVSIMQSRTFSSLPI